MGMDHTARAVALGGFTFAIRSMRYLRRMEQTPRLKSLERKILLSIPSLFPDGDSDDLKIRGASREAISYAIQHLVGLKLISASEHEGEHLLALYYRDVELTPQGEELR